MHTSKKKNEILNHFQPNWPEPIFVLSLMHLMAKFYVETNQESSLWNHFCQFLILYK